MYKSVFKSVTQLITPTFNLMYQYLSFFFFTVPLWIHIVAFVELVFDHLVTADG